jgi:hypothetical protein
VVQREGRNVRRVELHRPGHGRLRAQLSTFLDVQRCAFTHPRHPRTRRVYILTVAFIVCLCRPPVRVPRLSSPGWEGFHHDDFHHASGAIFISRTNDDRLTTVACCVCVLNAACVSRSCSPTPMTVAVAVAATVACGAVWGRAAVVPAVLALFSAARCPARTRRT